MWVAFAKLYVMVSVGLLSVGLAGIGFWSLFSSTPANLLRIAAETLASLGGFKKRVVASEHKLNHRYVLPSSEENKFSWDDTHFVNGNLFLKGKANPVNLSPDEPEGMYPSKKYRSFMSQSLVEDLVRASEDSGISVGEAVLYLMMFHAVSIVLGGYLVANQLGVV